MISRKHDQAISRNTKLFQVIFRISNILLSLFFFSPTGYISLFSRLTYNQIILRCAAPKNSTANYCATIISVLRTCTVKNGIDLHGPAHRNICRRNRTQNQQRCRAQQYLQKASHPKSAKVQSTVILTLWQIPIHNVIFTWFLQSKTGKL
jgi:hypothetical protein